MQRQTLFRAATVWVMVHAVLLCGGCGTTQRSGDEESDREFGGAEAGQRITAEELDGLTRAFADRYVGLLYSVCDDLTEENPDPLQRRAAQVLLVDNATNIYDIASNADAFTRMLDLVVATTLVSRVWDDDGRAVEVFGERGEALAYALARAREEAWALATQVLSPEQLATFDLLLRQWREENPEMVRASFVRFSNFALGRNRSAAADVLEARGLFAEIGDAGQAVDEVRLLGDRMFYWSKRAPTLMRWQSAAIKSDWVATPEIETALNEINRLTQQMEKFPANIATERQAIFDGVDDRFQDADNTLAKVQDTIDQANGFAQSLEPLTNALQQLFETGDDLFVKFDAWDRWNTENRTRPFDILEYKQTASEIANAAQQMDELFTRTEQMLDSPERGDGMQRVNESVDGHITAVANQSEDVIDTLFWRGCALLVVFFVLLMSYRLIVYFFLRDRQPTSRPGPGGADAS